MREKIIVSDTNEFGDKHKAIETAKAITEIMEARSFILITCGNENSAGRSSVEGQDIIPLIIGLKKMIHHLKSVIDKLGDVENDTKSA
jgi:hypothetical protein